MQIQIFVIIESDNNRELYETLPNSSTWAHAHRYRLGTDLNRRCYHEFVDIIDNSVPRVTAWHHEALSSDAKQ